MQTITEQQILALAPNPNAAANGKKLSQKGNFVRLCRAEDDSFYMGECKGSGSSNYITTADFADGSPVCGCSCPSRQYPCKHALGLLYEIAGKKSFAACEIPEDVLKKREKRKKKEEKGTPEQSKEKTSKPSRASVRARLKKQQAQMEGLEQTKKLVRELLTAGLGTMGGQTLTSYRQLAKQLGDYYLPGPQRLLNRLILEMETYQQDGNESHYEAALRILEKLWTLIKKAQQYIGERIEQEEGSLDADPLYESLGGVWKMSELAALGLAKEQVSLMQLAFWTTYDDAAKEYVDIGCWADMETGEILESRNIRPVKALKYIRQEDSFFGVAQAERAVYYPGDGNRRMRFENALLREETKEDRLQIRKLAGTDLAALGKQAKNYLKNPLSEDSLTCLIAYERIERTTAGCTLFDRAGNAVALRQRPQTEGETRPLFVCIDEETAKNQVLLGSYWFDIESGRLFLAPLSIVTEEQTIRL